MGAEVDKLLGLDPTMPREAWQRLKGWYKAAVDCAPPPARVTLERITEERVDLYSYVPPSGTHWSLTKIGRDQCHSTGL